MPDKNTTDAPRRVTARFRSTAWNEIALGDDIEPKLTRAECTQEYTGDIVGTSLLQYLMSYRDGGAASFVGMERVTGSVDGRRGHFALQHEGVFENGVARMTLQVVPGSGTGELVGLRGSGHFESPHAESYELTLECRFDS